MRPDKLKHFKCVVIKISQMCIPDTGIDNTSAFDHVMAWHCSSDKPLSVPIVIQLANTYDIQMAGFQFEYIWNSEKCFQ